MMRISQFCLAAAGLAALLFAVPAQADLLITIDKTAQRMTVTQDGEQLHVWPVSTGGSGYDTPNGDWKPFRMEKDHFSKEWDDAPMPNSIFFTTQGHAIHGTFETKNLGKPVSHGCVRLSRANSEVLWGLVKKNKMANTKVVLTGEIPGGAGTPVARRPSSRQQQQAQDYQRYYSTDDEYDDYVAAQRQRAARGFHEYYNDSPRYYYDRDPPPERRYYRAGSNNRGFFSLFGN
jgi:hypothetical protein